MANATLVQQLAKPGSLLMHYHKPASQRNPAQAGARPCRHSSYDAIDGYAVREPPCSWHFASRFCTYLSSRRQYPGLSVPWLNVTPLLDARGFASWKS